MYTGYCESHERRGNVGRNASGEKLPGETTEAGRERERAGAGISGWRLGGQGVAHSGGRRLQGLTSTDILRCGAEAARWSPGHQYTPRERRLPCINILSPQIDLLASVGAGYIRRREEYFILAIFSHFSILTGSGPRLVIDPFLPAGPGLG